VNLEVALRATSRATRSALLAAETFGRVRFEQDARVHGAGRRSRAFVRAAAKQLRMCAASALDVHGVEVRFDGELPASPSVIVANHRSWLDPLVLLALAPAAPIAKAEVARWPLVGPLASSLGTIFVERNNAASGARALRNALAVLYAGVSVVGFPEGTTTTGAPIEFRRGLFGLARIARVPLVPVAICGDEALSWVGDDALAPHWMSLCAQRSHVVRVHFCPPIQVDTNVDACAEDLAAVARAVITESYEEMQCRNTT
jgi:1-acyl-sn-glycerol-3-phosphate acyltransferase